MISEETAQRLIREGRDFMRAGGEVGRYLEEYETEQERRLPQPPLVKAAVTPVETHIPLTRDFSGLKLNNDLVSLFRDRKSSRVYSGGDMSADALSFLLWATQGVKGIRGKAYATLRTVPSGGARHEYETYLAVLKITGLEPGIYHYLPMEHALEFLRALPEPDTDISASLLGQKWASRANAVFYWACVAHREEWRYGFFGHRVALVDAGHIGQNLYLACTGLGLGTCEVGALDQNACNRMLGLDGEEEFAVLAAPVGTVREADRKEEQAFYRFVEDEGL